MRLRRKPHTLEKILKEEAFFLSKPEQYLGKWPSVFGNSQPLFLEIGMGGGNFLTAHAAQNRQANFIGMEKKEGLIEFAIQKAKALDLENIKMLLFNAELVEQVFAENEIESIYLNFSDPWPKKRHSKRRLSAGGFLEKYRRILKPGGILQLRTDNAALFAFSMQQFAEQNWAIERETTDLHNEAYFDGITTEYEDRFSKLGQTIFYLLARAK